MDKVKLKKISIILITVAILITILGLYLGLPTEKRYNNIIMGGLNMQTVIKANLFQQKEVGGRLFEAVTKVDKLINPTDTNSDIYKINNAKQDVEVKVDPLTIELLEISYDVYQKTGKLYNPAVYTLVDMWGFSADKFSDTTTHKEPSLEEIELGKQLADSFKDTMFYDSNDSKEEYEIKKSNASFFVDKVSNTVTKTAKCFFKNPTSPEGLESAKIDLGGIAKGYASELCYKVFSTSQAENGLVNIGGNVYTYNKNWGVGIENPFKYNILENGKSESGIFGVVQLNNLSISCSGIYERNYKIDDKFYHHIINPITGRPSEITDDSIIMAGVIGKNGAICDAIATSLILLDSIENAENFIKSNYQKEISAVILITKNRNYKILGNVSFEFNKQELTGFTELK